MVGAPRVDRAVLSETKLWPPAGRGRADAALSSSCSNDSTCLTRRWRNKNTRRLLVTCALANLFMARRHLLALPRSKMKIPDLSESRRVVFVPFPASSKCLTYGVALPEKGRATPVFQLLFLEGYS